jgi:hypothetical protein
MSATTTSFATRGKNEIAIRAKITSNDCGTVCAAYVARRIHSASCEEISIQDATEPGEIIVCFHRGRQILRDRGALKKLRCSRVCWG